jgi:hypothetical protein
LLVKESAWPVFAAGTLWLAFAARDRREAGRGGGAFPPAMALVAGGVVIGLAVLAVVGACGGVTELARTWQAAKVAGAPNEYMRHYQSGSPLYYVVGLGFLQPVPFVLGFLGALVAVIRPEWIADHPAPPAKRAGLRALGGFAIGFALLAALFPQKNLRFVSPLTAPFAILAATLLRATMNRLAVRTPRWRWWAGVTMGALLVALAAIDVARFQEYFDRRGIDDPVTPIFFEDAPPVAR